VGEWGAPSLEQPHALWLQSFTSTRLLVHTSTRLHPTSLPDSQASHPVTGPSIVRQAPPPRLCRKRLSRHRVMFLMGVQAQAFAALPAPSLTFSHLFSRVWPPLPEPHRTVVGAGPRIVNAKKDGVPWPWHMIWSYACWRTPRRRPRDKLEFVSRSLRSCS
jgi:hypothetical protein